MANLHQMPVNNRERRQEAKSLGVADTGVNFWKAAQINGDLSLRDYNRLSCTLF
jgi:hypothetical protein